MTQTHITFRASPILVARIDRLAEATGSSRSAAIKRSILEATTPAEAQPVPDEHEVLMLLSTAARGGSVPAMRELLAYHREQRKPAEFDAPRDLDELSVRRGRGRHRHDLAQRAPRDACWPRPSPARRHERSIKALSTYMGHASVTITYDRYGHLMPGNEGQAADLLDAYLERATRGPTVAQTVAHRTP